MNKELETWFLTEFWPAYLLLMRTPKSCDHGAGNKGTCLVSIEKLKPSKELREKMVKHIHDQITHRNLYFDRLNKDIQRYNQETYKSQHRKFYANRMASTWINNKGWYDDIPTLDAYSKPSQGACIVCGKPTLGTHFRHCIEHLPVQGLTVVK